ncbi:hypothetical protein NL316_27415, partial [Klebsiella pneumoniae]|nr:hypothetical protein [Klebsiella pneumoniae]
MPIYLYKGVDQAGTDIEGGVEADSEAGALELLKDRGFKVRSLEKREDELFETRFTFLQRVTSS